MTKKQLSKVTYEDGTTKSYTYNSNGDLESITDTNGVIKTFEYESVGLSGLDKWGHYNLCNIFS